MAHIFATLAVLSALLPLTAAQQACPAPSTTNISCYNGYTWSGAAQLSASYQSTAGQCTCDCGVGSSSDDYVKNPLVGTTVFYVATQAGCTPAACTAKYPHFCANGQGGGPNDFYSIANMLSDNAPSSEAVGVGGICMILTVPCNASTSSGCEPSLLNGTTIGYTYFEPPTAAADCATTLQMLPQYPGSKVLQMCTTNNCNAPGSGTPAPAGNTPATTPAPAGSNPTPAQAATTLPAATLAQAPPSGTAVTSLSQIKPDTSAFGGLTPFTVTATATVRFTGTMTALALWNATNFESALLNGPYDGPQMSFINSLVGLGAQPPANGVFTFTYTIGAQFYADATGCTLSSSTINNVGWLLDTTACGAANALALFGNTNDANTMFFSGNGLSFVDLFAGATVTSVSIVPVSYVADDPAITVTAAISLAGATAASLQPTAAQTALINTLATSLSAQPSELAIVSITDAPAGSGRRLTAAAANVAFTVDASSASDAAATSGAIKGLGSSFISALNVNLASSGVTGVTISSVAVSSAPVTTTTLGPSSGAATARTITLAAIVAAAVPAMLW